MYCVRNLLLDVVAELRFMEEKIKHYWSALGIGFVTIQIYSGGSNMNN